MRALGAGRPIRSLAVGGEDRVGAVEEAVDAEPDRLNPSQVRLDRVLRVRRRALFRRRTLRAASAEAATASATRARRSVPVSAAAPAAAAGGRGWWWIRGCARRWSGSAAASRGGRCSAREPRRWSSSLGTPAATRDRRGDRDRRDDRPSLTFDQSSRSSGCRRPAVAGRVWDTDERAGFDPRVRIVIRRDVSCRPWTRWASPIAAGRSEAADGRSHGRLPGDRRPGRPSVPRALRRCCSSTTSGRRAGSSERRRSSTRGRRGPRPGRLEGRPSPQPGVVPQPAGEPRGDGPGGLGAPRVRARVASPAERERLWPKAVEVYGGYAGYQERTEREIPLVILEPRA